MRRVFAAAACSLAACDRTAPNAMSTVEEFVLIESQLRWLEGHLRDQPQADDSGQMQGAIEALACARALITELSIIGNATSDATAT